MLNDQNRLCTCETFYLKALREKVANSTANSLLFDKIADYQLKLKGLDVSCAW